ncbi:hypothetical protein BDQ12DRAFT_711626 [Crucibulum laeve]|uniref:Uncharacterized protein n=1 Tax=Crucibulum laeve TaxID=68775 RepID=A0A5C3M494_9AGAR|nr:hypothetical protein BDQ12DRAFT_711626 [Crucibulum laeve]
MSSGMGFPTASQRREALERIDKSQSRIALLRLEIEFLSMEIEQDRFFIAPHRRLPSEVLGEIFAHTAPHGSGTWMAPFVLSQVSRHWRTVVKHTSAAWNHICVRIVANINSLQIIKLWLKRSGFLPLYLRFETPDGKAAQTTEAIHSGSLAGVLAILLPHVARWNSLTIFIGDAPYHSLWNIQALLQQFNFEMPALQAFSLDTAKHLWQDYHVLKGSMPRLRELVIGRCRPTTTSHWLPHLQHLHIGHATHCLFYIHSLLRVCSQLKTLRLDALIPDREPPPGLEPIVFPRLERIQVNNLKYMAFLRLPKLRSFEFGKRSPTGAHEGFMLITSLRMMLLMSRNTCLRTLTLRNVVASPIAFSSLRDIPSLEIFCMSNCPVILTTVDILKDATLCPRLHTLEFFECNLDSCAVLELVEIRNKACAKDGASIIQKVVMVNLPTGDGDISTLA